MTRPVITAPGVYEIDEAAYHLDPVPDGSLSQSGAKKLLQDGGPALFRYERDHPPEPTSEMELGTAAHKLVLGIGADLVEIKAKDYYTKPAKQARDDARERGAVPLLTHQLETVHAMAAELRRHERASQLLDRDRGRPEMSAFWQDPDYKIWRRLRWDLMPEPDPRRRPIVADYKTTGLGGAAPKEFAKQMANLRYYGQADWYTAGYAAVFGDRIGDWPGFAFIVQERTPPYRVACYQLHPDALRKGRADNERAMEIYRDCTEAEADGRASAWPGYSSEIEVIDLPYWSYRED